MDINQREREREMAEEKRVTLHGVWASPYVKRVELALKVKGIPFDYVEEDLKNKSPLLLTYNPVHKKVPILVHNGKPITESLVILEYIDDTWKNTGPPLLPQDPYKRSQVRFWATFIHQQIFEALILVVKSDGEEQKKAMEETFEKIKLVEEGIKSIFPEGIIPPIHHDNVGVLEMVFLSIFGPYKVHEEVFGVKIIGPEKTPLLFSWLKALLEVPVVKEALPPHEKLVGFLKYIRQSALNSTAV